MKRLLQGRQPAYVRAWLARPAAGSAFGETGRAVGSVAGFAASCRCPVDRDLRRAPVSARRLPTPVMRRRRTRQRSGWALVRPAVAAVRRRSASLATPARPVRRSVRRFVFARDRPDNLLSSRRLIGVRVINVVSRPAGGATIGGGGFLEG